MREFINIVEAFTQQWIMDGSEPMVVYHGTREPWESVEDGETYFAKKKSDAQSYGRFVYAANIWMNNPLMTDDIDEFAECVHDIQRFKSEGYDGIVFDDQYVVFDVKRQARLLTPLDTYLDEDIGDPPYDQNDPVVVKYVEGKCYALAVAHHRRFGWPIYVLGADDHDYAEHGLNTEFFHGMVLHPTGVVLDITGPHSPQEFIEKWGEPFFKIGDEANLMRHLNDFMRSETLSDQAEANKTIDNYLMPKFPQLYKGYE